MKIHRAILILGKTADRPSPSISLSKYLKTYMHYIAKNRDTIRRLLFYTQTQPIPSVCFTGLLRHPFKDGGH